jgi:type II secretory pathway component PulC
MLMFACFTYIVLAPLIKQSVLKGFAIAPRKSAH